MRPSPSRSLASQVGKAAPWPGGMTKIGIADARYITNSASAERHGGGRCPSRAETRCELSRDGTTRRQQKNVDGSDAGINQGELGELPCLLARTDGSSRCCKVAPRRAQTKAVGHGTVVFGMPPIAVWHAVSPRLQRFQGPVTRGAAPVAGADSARTSGLDVRFGSEGHRACRPLGGSRQNTWGFGGSPSPRASLRPSLTMQLATIMLKCRRQQPTVEASRQRPITRRGSVLIGAREPSRPDPHGLAFSTLAGAVRPAEDHMAGGQSTWCGCQFQGSASSHVPDTDIRRVRRVETATA